MLHGLELAVVSKPRWNLRLQLAMVSNISAKIESSSTANVLHGAIFFPASFFSVEMIFYFDGFASGQINKISWDGGCHA